ncbi:MAG: hypothetical protein R3D98_00890 [Candidatus Krumholzibacteriia bacterium]
MRQRLTIIFAAILLAVATSPAGAGTARVLALGDDDQFLVDEANVLRWYADLVAHPDLAFVELGDPVHGQDRAFAGRSLIGHGGGVHLRLDTDGTWGTVAFTFEDRLVRGANDGAFSLLWGRRLGGVDVGLGGRFTTFGRSRAGTAVGDRIDSEYLHQYEFGVAGPLRDGLRLELAGEVINTLTESSGALYRLSAREWTSFGLRARGLVEVSPTVTLVPAVDYTRILRALDSALLGGPADRDAYQTSLGLGANLRPDADTLVLISSEYRVGRDDLRERGAGGADLAWQRSDREYYQLRGRVGLETEVLPWLTARVAVQYVRLHEEVDRRHADGGARDARNLEAVATPLAFGLGLRQGRLTVDLMYNDTAPVNAGLQAEGLFAGDGPGMAAVTVGWSF